MSFAEELARALPEDVPQRESVIEKAAKHLELVAQANEYMNLTRIATPKEAAIKHVADSLWPWRHFVQARRVLDAGTGAGFPGIPLAIALPEVHFTLAESIQKKARFVESAVEALGLRNVEVAAERAESVALLEKPEVITARAVAPLERVVETFRKSLDRGMRLLLYKGPDAEAEFSALHGDRVEAQVIERYELPENFGVRTLVAVAGHKARARKA
ncbi:MAG TPA: 16S rRNA (guanine(527)-N(7))-methyltransferase RsmG [Bryobacteraceae bacterium]|nr:16S rRNA (guanine(527)-N(7))-methyltransferase RsmG [Bryobacteraceae bacterium]